jgi:putative copper export protein
MIDALWLALRAGGFVFTVQAAGTGLFLVLFARELDVGSGALIRRVGAHAAIGALGIVIAQALFEPLYLAGAWDGLRDPALRTLAYFSPAAIVPALRLAGLGALVLALRRASSALDGFVLPAALLALGSFLATGHALLDPRRLLLIPVLAVHVLVAAFWFGSLAALRMLLRHQPPQVLVSVLRSFSERALWLVPLLLLAGVLLACLLLPDLAALRRPYGLLLCLKVLLFTLLMALAALNRLRFAPALARGEAVTTHLRRTLTAEYLLLATVLIVTAAMTGLFSPAEASVS